MADNRPYDVITFDCYGTLIDWEARHPRRVPRGGGRATACQLDPGAALRAVFEREPEVQAEHYRSYREVLTESRPAVAARLGWALAAARRVPGREPAALEPVPRHQRRARAALRGGLPARHPLQRGRRPAGRYAPSLHGGLHLLVTAQQVRSYKPASGHFTTARERIGGRALAPRRPELLPRHHARRRPARAGRPGSTARACSRPAPPAADREFRTLDRAGRLARLSVVRRGRLGGRPASTAGR